MKSTTKISRYLNSITQEKVFTNRMASNFHNSPEDMWKRLKHYAY